MALNGDKIIKRYGNGMREENRSSGNVAEYLMEYKYTKKILKKYVTKENTALEIGCDTGYYGMYLTDKCQEYTGIDITPGNIELFNTKIKSNGLMNVKALVGDATNLYNIKDDSFDVVLTFGPMYHLPPEERELVFAESKEFVKKWDNHVCIYK